MSLDDDLSWYADLWNEVEARKADRQFSPAVLKQHAAEQRARARVEAEREAIEEAQNTLERWAERWARSAEDERFVLPDRASGDPLLRDRSAL